VLELFGQGVVDAMRRALNASWLHELAAENHLS